MRGVEREDIGPQGIREHFGFDPNRGEAERFWKAYAHVHNAKRNRLDTERAVKLVRVHYNLRLRGRRRDAEAEAEHLPPMELNLEGLQAIETEADELVVSEE